MASDISLMPYENTWTLEGAEPEIGFTFFSLPTDQCGPEGLAFLKNPEQHAKTFGGVEAINAVLISELPWTVFETLLAAETAEQSTVRPDREWLRQNSSERNQVRYALAEYLTFTELVTFELSEPKEHSLGSLAAKSAGRIVRKGKGALGWVGIGKEAGAIAGGPAAILGLALAPIAFKVVIGGTGIVLVADTIGAVAGVAKSERTAEAYRKATEAVRQIFKRLSKHK